MSKSCNIYSTLNININSQKENDKILLEKNKLENELNFIKSSFNDLKNKFEEELNSKKEKEEKIIGDLIEKEDKKYEELFKKLLKNQRNKYCNKILYSSQITEIVAFKKKNHLCFLKRMQQKMN